MSITSTLLSHTPHDLPAHTSGRLILRCTSYNSTTTPHLTPIRSPDKGKRYIERCAGQPSLRGESQRLEAVGVRFYTKRHVDQVSWGRETTNTPQYDPHTTWSAKRKLPRPKKDPNLKMVTWV